MAQFKYKRNDTHPDHVTVLEGRDENPEDLTGVTQVLFIMREVNTSTPKVNRQAMSVDGDPTNGQVRYVWQAGDTDTGGFFLGEYEVTFGTGKKQTYPTVGQDQIIIYSDLDQM